MQEVVSPSVTPINLDRLYQLWLIDEPTLALLAAVRPAISAALQGIEQELDEIFLTDPASEHVLADVASRHQEVEQLTAFCHTVFRGPFDQSAAERAIELGRRHADLGLDGRALLAASQRVLRRAHGGVFAAAPADLLPTIHAVTRLVLLGADLALTALNKRIAERVHGTSSGKAAEELQEQIHQLEEMARVDGLTKLFNRRHFDKSLEAEVSRAHRYGQKLCLIMADVDFFKRINDNYGHTVGDEVLCHVAEVLASGARRSDLIARYGGEEFAIILTATPGDHAELVAERMRSALEQRPVAFADGHVVRVTISLGFAALGENEQPKSLLERADAALYRAKEAGRNRVCG
jgi:diguanylate cyclase (GGDEF)-like protein